jgi:hypothetical protein
MSLSSHQKTTTRETEEWLTPPNILKPLGIFDLDPCAPVIRPWDTAKKHFTTEDDGLIQKWKGRVWCNPPFGREVIKWLHKMKDHGNGIALIPARTETRMFYETVWGFAEGVCFIKGRPHFYTVAGDKAPFNSGAPMCLVAYGEKNLAGLRRSNLGFVVTCKN